MKVAIIGSGFFGLCIARMFENRKELKSELSIFEAASKPFSGASFNNQCRVHQGFHYPRSAFTMHQSILGFNRFISEFSSAVNPVSENWYLIRDNGLVDATQYLAVMDAFSLDYNVCESPPSYVKNQNQYQLSILTKEYSINLKNLRKILLDRIENKIKLQKKIVEIDAHQGFLYTVDGTYGPFDLIVNCTYSNPNLGLGQNSFNLKYELAALVYGKTSLKKNEAITIMDGPFVSVYPAYEGRHTLSSVIYTPFKKYADYELFSSDYKKRVDLAQKEDVGAKIIEEVKKYLQIDTECEKIWVTGKTKLASDKGDSREVLVNKNKKVISVLGGKLDAVYEAKRKILEYIYEI